VKEGKLKYCYNFVGTHEQIIDSDREVSPGKHVLSSVFTRDGTSMPARGKLALYIDEEKVGEGEIMTQPGNFSLVGEGLNVGKDPGEPVTSDYTGERPFGFTGGRIYEVIVDVSGEAYLDLEKEAIAMMARE
jgi:arylsulfatase